jgi:putative ABC transport system permease protein
MRLALRELRGGLTGLRLLAICLFLGVAALGGVGSLSASILAGLSSSAQEIAGGDVEARVAGRLATRQERAAIARFGTLSAKVQMRAMVGVPGGERILGELKAVDDAHPLYGTVLLEGGGALDPALARGAVIARAIADRLDLEVGDRVEVGAATLPVAAILVSEPDQAGAGFTFGPSILVGMDALPATRLLQPGSLFRTSYRLKIGAAEDPVAVAERVREQLPEAGWQVRDRSEGAPGVRRFVEQLGQFLTLVGLTALVVAGVGVGNGVASYLDSKSSAIASLKSLGATSTLIFQSYLAQIALVAAGAVVAGSIVAALVPWVVVLVAGSAMPVPPRLGVYPVALATGAAYGLAIAVAFALPPLSRAARLPAARLFRDRVEGAGRPSNTVVAGVVLAVVAIVALAIGGARQPIFAAGFIAAAAALLVVLVGLAALVRALAARAPRPKRTLARLALANLHRPGAPTRQLVVALGLGLTLFATLAVIETNLAGQIERTIPTKAPNYFFVDIPTTDAAPFREAVERIAPSSELVMVPSLRGPVTAVNGTPVTELKIIPENAWILRGDRGLTYSATPPPNSRLTEGRWWPADYAGPPLVSVDSEAGRALGLEVGDTITVSVLGVDLTATIASFRAIDWDSMQFNFALVFSPGVLEGAPHSYMATVTAPQAQDRTLYRELTRSFPTVTAVRVKDVIGAVANVMAQVSSAVRAAAGVTIAAGIAVLVGAVAAGRRARVYDAVLLKVLGATRGQVLRSILLEYGLLGLIVAGLAFVLGGAAGWYVVTQVFELEWQPRWGPVALTVLAGALLTIALGLIGSWRALAAKPNRVLRTL